MGAETVSAAPLKPKVQLWADQCEWLAIAACFAGLLALKTVAACRYRFNSDEPQHLHVIWGWVHGFVQYRDLFDNHPPLFHMLMAPLLRLFPERADIVVPMRLMMVPVYAAGLLALFHIGRSLYSARAGAWLALIAGALPWVFFPGTEFRPDDLYAMFLFWALAIAMKEGMTRTRMALIGLLLGICVCLTLKTALAMASLALAGAIALALSCWLARWRIRPGETMLRFLICGAASLVAPGLLCLWFARQRALPALYYCVFLHNVVPHAERWSGSTLHFYYLPMALPFLLATAAWIFKHEPKSDIAIRRAMIFLFPFFYLLLLYAYWPDITAQDNLPFIPLLPLALMPMAAVGVGLIPGQLAVPASYLLPPAAFVFSVSLIYGEHAIQRASVDKYVRPIATVLRLATPREYVMDLKGDSIYRPRPFYYAIETFTRARMRLGWIRNDIVAGLIATRTAVCFHPPFPGVSTMTFVNRNYLPLAGEPHVMVLGQKLVAASDGVMHFEIAIPGEYVLLRQGVPVAGKLDGTVSTDPFLLAEGPHQFIPAAGNAPVMLFWERAWRLGYAPAE